MLGLWTPSNAAHCLVGLQEFKGYVFKIMGGQDKQGFPMKQGVLVPGRVQLLMTPGDTCFRGFGRRKGERRRKSVRGCIVSPDLSVLNLMIVKKGKSSLHGACLVVTLPAPAYCIPMLSCIDVHQTSCQLARTDQARLVLSGLCGSMIICQQLRFLAGLYVLIKYQYANH